MTVEIPDEEFGVHRAMTNYQVQANLTSSSNMLYSIVLW